MGMNEEQWYEMTCEQDARTPYTPAQTLTPAQLAGEDEEPEEWFGYDIDRLPTPPAPLTTALARDQAGGLLQDSQLNKEQGHDHDQNIRFTEDRRR
jgi:hypothetical protein